MRITGWRLPQICDEIKALAIDGANHTMDDHVQMSRALCPVGTVTREGGFKMANISFIATTRKRRKIPEHLQRRVSFQTQQWTGREPGSLRATIRRVNKLSRPGNVRVYAGNKKVNYAHFVEYGTAKMRKRPYMRPAFQIAKKEFKRNIEQAMASHYEVK